LRSFPDRWDEYDRGPLTDSPLHVGIPDHLRPVFPSVWAFQLTHVLSGCVDMDDSYWMSMWHYRPVCDDPCAEISKALRGAYNLVEVLLTATGVKKWGKFHRAHRKRNTLKR